MLSETSQSMCANKTVLHYCWSAQTPEGKNTNKSTTKSLCQNVIQQKCLPIFCSEICMYDTLKPIINYLSGTNHSSLGLPGACVLTDSIFQIILSIDLCHCCCGSSIKLANTWIWSSNLHKYCIPLPVGPSSCPKGKSNWLLSQNIFASDGMDRWFNEF